MPKRRSSPPTAEAVRAAIVALKRLASARYRAGMARYAIPTEHALGVPMGKIQALAKQMKRDGRTQPDNARARHELALALWKTGVYEAQILAVFLDDPALVTRAQMNAWVRSFDNWAICDTACFQLFDKSPLAWAQASTWAASPREFIRRAGFALMASLALHDKEAPDAKFTPFLPLIERGSTDDRNFVKKGVSWALRGIGQRSPALHRSAKALAKRLGKSEVAAARWVGKDAFNDLSRPMVAKRLAKRG